MDWQPGETGRDMLAALRATYEPLMDGLAQYLMLRIPGWLPDEDGADNWQQGPRGLIAGRLIEELAGRWTPPEEETPPEPVLPDRLNTWRNMRRKLRADAPD